MSITNVFPNAEQYDVQNTILNLIANKLGAFDEPLSWVALQAQVRAGSIGWMLRPEDQLSVGINNAAFDFDVQGIDEDEPVNPSLHHVLSLQSHETLPMSGVRFDPQQYLYSVQVSEWPDGLPAGKYKVTLDHGAMDGTTGQDGTYVFTTTQVVPVGGGVRHTTIGMSQSGGYNKSQITNGKFMTYGSDTLTTIESNLATTEYDPAADSDAVSLGTTTYHDPSYKSGDYINFACRAYAGGNRWSTSWIRQCLNSDEAVFTWMPATIWSRNVSGTYEGFLHSIDPELKSVLCKVRTRYALSLPDGYGYEDVEDYVKLNTFLDVTGSQNHSISEGPVNADGEVTRTTAYSLWAMQDTDADRVKYENGTAKSWLLSSCGPSSGLYVRRVNINGTTSGIVTGNVSYDTVVPSLFIG